MRKIIFSLLATSLFSVSALAGNTIVKNNSIERKSDKKVFDLCGVMVTFYNSLGRPYKQEWHTSQQSSLTSCMAYQNGVIAELRLQGYRVEKASTQLSNDVN